MKKSFRSVGLKQGGARVQSKAMRGGRGEKSLGEAWSKAASKSGKGQRKRDSEEYGRVRRRGLGFLKNFSDGKENEQAWE